MDRELTWFAPPAPDGFVFTNELGGCKLLSGVSGLGAPDATITTDTTPLLDGAIVTDVYAPPRTIILPIRLTADTNAELRARIKLLVSLMDPAVPGQLEVAQSDGQRRRIYARYVSGLEGAEEKTTSGETFYFCVIKLLCVDPFWFDPTPITYRVEQPASGVETLPMPDAGGHYWNLVPSVVLGNVTLTNSGDVPGWMTWTITPPATTITIADLDTGESFAFGTALPAGKSLTVVTQPTLTDITLSDGTDWWDKLTGIPSLFPLRPGDNNLSVAVTGSSTGTSVEGSFTPRYRSAW